MAFDAFVIPPVVPNSCQWMLHDYTGAQESVLSGAIRTASRGQRWGCRLSYHDLKGVDRALMSTFVAQIRGKANRVWLRDYSYIPQGSFSAPELYTNADFSNGSTGWTVDQGTLIGRKGLGRVICTTAGIGNTEIYQAVALQTYVPHMLRSLIVDGQGTAGISYGRAITGVPVQVSDYSTARGLGTIVGIPYISGYPQCAYVLGATSGFTAGAHVNIHYASMQRCAQVDNAPNMIATTTGNLAGASGWTASQVSGSLVGIDPAGQSSATLLTELTSTNVEHYIMTPAYSVGATVADFTGSAMLHAGTQSWAVIRLYDTGGSNDHAYAFINLATGAIGNVSATGTRWTNVRIASTFMGNGWYRLAVTATKGAGSSTIALIIESSNANGAFTYAGTSGAALYVYHPTLTSSGVPTRDSPTSGSATGGVPPSGTTCWLKGLPYSQNGLLIAGDMFEINGELKRATQDLNSDGCGIGFAQFEPALRSASITDGAPVVFGAPMGRFMMSSTPSVETRPGGFSDFDIELVEA